MDVEDAERFMQVAEEDYDRRRSVYLRLVEGDPHDAATEDLRDARADVLAAQQVLMLAQTELHRATVGYRPGAEASGSVQRLPIGESGQWLARGEGEGER